MGPMFAFPLLYRVVIHLEIAHYSGRLNGREKCRSERAQQKTEATSKWEVEAKEMEGNVIAKWCSNRKVVWEVEDSSEMEMPTLNLFICMVWFQKLCRKKQIKL